MKKRIQAFVFAVLMITSSVVSTIPVSSSEPEEGFQIAEVAEAKEIPEQPVTYECDIPEPEDPIVLSAEEESDMDILAKLVFGEGGILCEDEQEAIVWNVLNRIESSDFPDTIRDVVLQTKPCIQYSGYSEKHPIRQDIRDLCIDVWLKWNMERKGTSVERILPKKFTYFHSENGHNVYTTRWDHWNGGERFEF